MRRLMILVLVVLAGSCVRRVEPPTAMLERASAKVGSGSAESDALALAGFHALLVKASADEARARFEAALKTKPSEPWALYGLLVLSQRDAEPQRTLELALDLCERAPRHPLAVAAARVALDLASTAEGLDSRLRTRVPDVLTHGASGDVAHLLRAALVNAQNVKHSEQTQVLSDMGMVTVAALVGPWSAWHLLDLTTPTKAELKGQLDALGVGPWGPLAPRTLTFADGRFALSGEPAAGDVYLLAVDAEVPERTTWVLRTVTSMDHVALVDGTTVLSRLTTGQPASTLTAQAMVLGAGTHRVMIRMARHGQSGHLTVALQRADGRPARVRFTAAAGTPKSWDGVHTTGADQLFPTATSLYDALVDESGELLARFVAARDGLGRDHDGAARLLEGLVSDEAPRPPSATPAGFPSAALSAVRAELALRDPHVPARVARGRAQRELDTALELDPKYLAALLMSAQLALDDGRPLAALELTARARAVTRPTAPLASLEAHAQLALGLDANAVASAAEALSLLPGHCGALGLQFDVARRRDAVAEADALLARTETCPGFEVRSAEHWRARGLLEQARQRYASLLEQDQTQAQAGVSLAGVLAALRHFDEAIAVLERQRALWPRNTQVLKALGDIHEQAGHAQEALAVREAALALDGADLALRRAVVRAKTGGEVLAQDAISTEEALQTWDAAPGTEEATSTYVLDAAAIEGFADGSMVDRIHVIQKALDQQGVQDVAEVQLPPDAVVLKLRTLKADGRSLEPEAIEGKETVSLPGVQVGDFVEYEFLLAHPSRGPGQPGFTASNFYFQIARQPNSRSTYVVRAPKGSGLTVDAHHVQAPKVAVEGTQEVFRHEERRVPPYIPEPDGPPSGNEWLPFVSVGTGERGHEGILKSYADAFLDRGAVTWEVAAFARKAAAGATGRAAIEKVYTRVMDALAERDAGLSMSAAASVAQDRGSRTWLLFAALRALGFDARLAAVRTFAADPAPYVFPTEGLFNYVCLVVTLPEGPLWLDPVVRHAPFGELPDLALGGREAWLLPEPGRPAVSLKTPPRSSKVDKTVTLTMTLGADGVLSGDGVETYSGFDAAQLREGLDGMSPEQRDQALQSGLSRYYGGADLSSVAVDAKRECGGQVTISYHFVARRFARTEGTSLIAGPLTFPHLLGRRFVGTPSRTTPLFIASTEAAAVSATVKLPPGFTLTQPMSDVKVNTANGRFARSERQTGDVLVVTEDFRLDQARISPKDYADFAQFAGEVDLVQQRDLLFVPR